MRDKAGPIMEVTKSNQSTMVTGVAAIGLNVNMQIFLLCLV